MIQNLTELYQFSAKNYTNDISHRFRKGAEETSYTFHQTSQKIEQLAAAFYENGIRKGDHVGFFVDNRYEWILTDMALIRLQAISVPRGSDTTPMELEFIFNHSDSEYLILEDLTQLKGLLSSFDSKSWNRCRKIFVIDSFDLNEIAKPLHNKITFIDHLLECETVRLIDLEIQENIPAKKDDLVSIVYTSGTTGNPKGVMLSHQNFLQNVHANSLRLETDIKSGSHASTIVMLPSWHVYEKAFEYCCFFMGIRLFYSSARKFPYDLVNEKPDVIITVPRIWESIYTKMIKTISQMPAIKRFIFLLSVKINQLYLTSQNYIRGSYIVLRKRTLIGKILNFQLHLFRLSLLFFPHLLVKPIFKPIKAKLGGKLKLATCGAGALPKYLDELFNSMSIPIVNAYGMTECAPGIACRTMAKNAFGVTGTPFDNTKIEIRNKDGKITKVGEKGIIYCSGPQVMKGYYKNSTASDQVLDNGWLCTGDLAVRSESGEIIIVGREKDTIVLSSGENIEPEMIENVMAESAYIDHAVVLGQDKNTLSALIAVNEEELLRLAVELKIKVNEVNLDGINSIENDKIYNVLKEEIGKLVSKEKGFRPFERISSFVAIKNNFKIGEELTQSLKLRRKFIGDKYNSIVKKLFKDTNRKKK